MSADPEPPPAEPGRRERAGTWLALGGLAVLLLGGYGAAVALVGDTVPAGTQVGEVEIGGLTEAEAEDRLRSRLLPRAERPLQVRVAGRAYDLDPAEAGLRVDVPATAEAAVGGSRLDPRMLWDRLVGGGPLPPVLDVDERRLHAALRHIAEDVNQRAAEPWIGFVGHRVIPHRPLPGVRLDQAAAAEAVQGSWLVDVGLVPLPYDANRPAVGMHALRHALRTVARPAVSGPARLRVDDRTWVLPVRELAPALSVQVVRGRLRPVVDPRELADQVPRWVRTTGRSARDATVLIGAAGQPVVRPARAGLRYRPDGLANALEVAVGRRDRTARVRPTAVEPTVSTRAARGWGIERVVGSYRAPVPSTPGSVDAAGVVARAVDGAVLAPGDTFSFNARVGDRATRAAAADRVATTVFNAAWLAGLEDVDHTPPDVHAPGLPVGREVDVSWPRTDLRFRASTPQGVLVDARVLDPGAGPAAVQVRLWGRPHWSVTSRTSPRRDPVPPLTRVGAGRGCEPQPGSPGFSVDVTRTLTRQGETVGTDRLHTTYEPRPRVICRR